MKKRITTLLLALVLVVSLFAAVGCSSDTSTDSSSMTDAEREQYIQEKMVGSGKVLTEDELLDNGYELSTDGETENMIKLLSTGNYSLYVDFQNADFILVDEGAGTVYSSNSLKTTNNKGGSDILQLEAYDNTNKKYNFTTSEACVEDRTAFKIVQLNDSTIRLILGQRPRSPRSFGGYVQLDTFRNSEQGGCRDRRRHKSGIRGKNNRRQEPLQET